MESGISGLAQGWDKAMLSSATCHSHSSAGGVVPTGNGLYRSMKTACGCLVNFRSHFLHWETGSYQLWVLRVSLHLPPIPSGLSWSDFLGLCCPLHARTSWSDALAWMDCFSVTVHLSSLTLGKSCLTWASFPDAQKLCQAWQPWFQQY